MITPEELDRLKAENDKLKEVCAEIQQIVSWHYDPEADPGDRSPKDMTAHVNGLVYKLCESVL